MKHPRISKPATGPAQPAPAPLGPIAPAGIAVATSTSLPESDIPPRPAGRVATHNYYEVNKDRILATIKDKGRPETQDLWKIGSGQMTALLKRWKVELVDRRHKKKASAPAARKPLASAQLQDWSMAISRLPEHSNEPILGPEFTRSLMEVLDKVEDRLNKRPKNLLQGLPTFNDRWESATQVKWLETYRELAMMVLKP